MAARGEANPVKTSMYGSGSAAPLGTAAPGYRPFFLIAFYFAVLHLGVLVVGSGGLTPNTAIYLFGLVVVLIALILG